MFGPKRHQGKSMGRLIKWVFILVILGAGVIAAYAQWGDLSVTPGETVKEVTIEID
jgi:hypothetical protein